MALKSGGLADDFARLRGIGAVFLAFLVFELYASTASAAELEMNFTEGRANVGEEQLVDEALFGLPKTAQLKASFDPTTGDITGGELTVPEFSTHITHPIDADVRVAFEIGEIEGNFNQATGASVSGVLPGGP